MERVLTVGQSLNQWHMSLAGKVGCYTWTWMLIPKHMGSLDMMVPTERFLLIGLGDKNYLSSVNHLWVSLHWENTVKYQQKQ